MKLEKELVAASSVPLILSILSEGDSYGYAIIQRVKDLSGGKIEWTDGMLYPVLHWLEDRRMVRSRWEKADSGRKRKYSSIQPAGHRRNRPDGIGCISDGDGRHRPPGFQRGQPFTGHARFCDYSRLHDDAAHWRNGNLFCKPARL